MNELDGWIESIKKGQFLPENSLKKLCLQVGFARSRAISREVVGPLLSYCAVQL